MAVTQLVVAPTLAVQWSLQDPRALSTLVDSATVKWAKAIANGTGPDQADILWSDQRTLAAGANDDLDITGLPSSYFGFGFALAMARLRGLLLVNLSQVSGDVLVLDSSVANAYVGPFRGNANAQLVCGPDSPLLLMDKKDGFGQATVASRVVRISNPGANKITYQIVLFGNSA